MLITLNIINHVFDQIMLCKNGNIYILHRNVFYNHCIFVKNNSRGTLKYWVDEQGLLTKKATSDIHFIHKSCNTNFDIRGQFWSLTPKCFQSFAFNLQDITWPLRSNLIVRFSIKQELILLLQLSTPIWSSVL